MKSTSGAHRRVHVAHQPFISEDKDTDIIMVGPGTGIAPSRFMEQRALDGGSGKNWLLGDHPPTELLQGRNRVVD